MSEEEKTGTDQAGGTDQQTDSDSTKDDTSTAENKEEEGMKQAYLAEKQKRQEAEAAAEVAKAESEMAKAVQKKATAVQKPMTTYEQAKAELGLSDVEWLSEPQKDQVEARRAQLDNARTTQTIAQATARQFMDSHDDFAEAVGTVHPVTGEFIPSKEVIQILAKEPYLRASIFQGPESAYKIVMKHRKAAEKEAKLATLEEHQAALSEDDKLKPMSPGSRGGGSSTKRTYKTAEDVRAMEREIEAGLHG